MVPILRRTPREDQLYSCNFTSGGIPIAPEKMLDTHIATDLIGDATFDVYDIAADRVGGQRLRAGRRFRAGDAQQARDPRRLRRPHERPAQPSATTASISARIALFRRMQRVKAGNGGETTTTKPTGGQRPPGGGRR